VGSSSIAVRPAPRARTSRPIALVADDYYLAEGTGLAKRYVAPAHTRGGTWRALDEVVGIRAGGTLDGPAYERWVAGYDVETGAPKG
jgi:hypothetical protein